MVGIPKKIWDFGVDVYEFFTEALEADDFSKLRVMERIVIRSKVIIDNTGDELKVYNIEGSPIVETAAGGGVTLANGKMVAVSADGKLGSPQTFDVKAVENAFNNSGGVPLSSSTTAGKPSVIPYVVGAGVLLVIIVAGIILRKKKTA